MHPSGPLLGILGGMGPLATADFLAQLVKAGTAARDQDHCRAIIYSNPRIPDRSDAIIGRGPSPLPDLVTGISFLERCGAEAIAIPCNTAHYWLEALVAAASVPIISIVQAVETELRARCRPGASVGILGTRGMIHSLTYQNGLSALGYTVLVPNDESLERCVEPGIRAVKSGDLRAARDPLAAAVAELERDGADVVVLGCTEIPLVLSAPRSKAGTPLIDSTRSLASACLHWASAREAEMMPA